MRKPSEATTIWAILAVGSMTRMVFALVVFPGRGFEGDLRYFADWAAAMADFGPAAFYANVATANYPPAYMLLLWPIGLAAPVVADAVGRDPQSVGLVLVKIPALVADVGIALLLLTAGRRWWRPSVGAAAAALFLLAPIVWYDSAIWGQVDSVAALPVLAALVLLVDRRPGWAVACATLAVLVKPQSAVVLGVVIPVLLRRHLFDTRDFLALFRSGLGMASVFLIVCMPFDLEHFTRGRFRDVALLGDVAGLWQLFRSVGDTFDALTVNAYNGWALVGPRPLVRDPGSGLDAWTPDSLVISLPILGAHSAVSLGAVLLAVSAAAVAVPLLLWPRLSDEPSVLLLAHAVLAAAFFAVPTRVHERYMFPVFVSTALLAVLATHWVVPYAIASVTSTLNLHSVLTGRVNPGFDTLVMDNRPAPRSGASANALESWSHALGTWSRTLPVATAVSLLHSFFFLFLCGVWAVTVHTLRRQALPTPQSQRPQVPRAWHDDAQPVASMSG